MALDNIQPKLGNKVCKHVANLLDELQYFLKDYLPLANSQGSEFIVDDLWEKMVPSNIQKELLEMSDNELSLLPSGKLGKCDVTDVSSRNVDLMNENCEECLERSLMSNKYPKLHDFVSVANKLTLDSYSVLTNVNDLHTIFGLDKTFLEDKFSCLLMSQKKSHEVDLMAELCSLLAESCSTKLTVDLGSGKGYLGTHLCYQFHHHVVGIDASHTNTDGAAKRAGRLGTRLKVQAESLKQASRADSVQENLTTKLCLTDIYQGNTEVQQLGYSLGAMKVGQDSRLDKMNSSLDNQKNSFCCEKQMIDCHCSSPASADFPPASPVCEVHHLQSQIENSIIATGATKECSECLTNKSKGCQICVDRIVKLEKTESVGKWSDRFVPITKYVDCNMKLKDSIRDAIGHLKLDADDPHILLTGLHTCGGLGSNILRLFVNSPSAVVLCNVACCYNLLEEGFVDSPCTEQSNSSGNTGDFPMSTYLQKRKFRLGKAARNIACLSVQRMACEKQLQGQSFYPRALLQKIVNDLVGQFEWEGHRLRKLGKRSKSLYDYIRKCFIKLDLPTEKLTPELVESYDKKYSHVQQKLSAFVQLRAVLAPCIETFILLDKYLYLLEQENVGNVYITQLFDPIISPRCYAIIATKNTV